MKLNESQIRQYSEEGYTTVKGLISPEEAAKVRARLLEVLEGRHNWSLDHFQVLDPSKFRNDDGSFMPIGVQQPAACEQVFRNIADHRNLQDAMAQLLDGPVGRYTDQALIKHRDVSGQSFYHQDSFYWRIEPELGCNAWIALDEVDVEASALAIKPGTHRSWTLTDHERYYDEPSFHRALNGTAFTRWRIPPDTIDMSDEAILPMSPGDAAFFTNFTWHRSEPNRSGRHLCAYAIAYKLKKEEES